MRRLRHVQGILAKTLSAGGGEGDALGLADQERRLAWGEKPVGCVGPVGSAGSAEVEGAESPATEEAALAPGLALATPAAALRRGPGRRRFRCRVLDHGADYRTVKAVARGPFPQIATFP